jgi:hypothetical protein
MGERLLPGSPPRMARNLTGGPGPSQELRNRTSLLMTGRGESPRRACTHSGGSPSQSLSGPTTIAYERFDRPMLALRSVAALTPASLQEE